MSADELPAADNIGFLEQGIRLIERLDDAAFTRAPEGPFRGGIGCQFRHCLDLYDCFLRGIEEGRVDYSARERDEGVERDRARAAGAARRLIDRLTQVDAARLGDRLLVRSEIEPQGASELWNPSSVGRELQFLLSHTVHHYALIAAMLTQQGLRTQDEVGELAEFGVAPSTLRYWRQSAPLGSG
jgi:uncharacterized damage-inducible protein DinB